MTSEDSDAFDEAVEDVEGASSGLLKGASGTLFPCFTSPFFTSLSSFFFHVRPWRMVACCFLQIWQVGLFAHPLAECPGAMQ